MNIYNVSTKGFDDEAVTILKNKLLSLQKKQQQVTVALSGGSTPLPILKKLANEDLNWDKFLFFMVDERCVPINDPQSNFGNIQNIFFNRISSRAFSMIQERGPLEESIKSFEDSIRHNVDFKNEFPVFDVIVLGMGEDGHTASLFPDTKALMEETKFVVKNNVPQLNTDRITLTYPAILNATNIMVIIKGDKKKKIFEDIYSSKKTDYPIAKIAQLHDSIDWIIEKQ